jgi:hypothetical protein
MFVTADRLQALAARPYEDVPVPELGAGETIRVVCLSALAKDRWDIGFWTPGEDGKPVYSAEGSRGRLLALTCCQEDLTPIFTDYAAGVAFFNGLRSDVADRLYEVAERISGLKADLESLKKAFGAVLAGASSTS